MFNNQICRGEVPSFLGKFDLSTAPPFLYYSYIPIIIISTFIGIFIYVKDKKSLKSQLLLSMITFFNFWVINILIQWIASFHATLMLAWQLTAIFEVGLFLTAFYFSYVFIFKKDLPFIVKTILWFLGIIVLYLTPTRFNVSFYDILNCEGVNGPLWNIIYIFEPVTISCIAFIGFRAVQRSRDKVFRKQITIFTIGIILLLTTFFISNLYGEVTKIYEFNLWGPTGMLVFFALLFYMIIKFNVFHVRVFYVQVLVVFIALLIGAELLYKTSYDNILLIIVTLVLFIISGIFLVRSVLNEIKQKEQLQKLSKDLQDSKMRIEETNLKLEEANEKLKGLDKLKTEFLSLASHQLRSPLTAIKGYTSMLMAGDFGNINDKQKETIGRVFESTNHLTKVVEDLLNVSKIEQGGMKYTMAPFDFEKAAKDLATDLSVTAKNKGLNMTFETDNLPAQAGKSPYTVNGDMEKIRQVILNLLDNSMKYTKSGTIAVKLAKDEKTKKILLSIKDTGMGIPPEIKTTLFQKFARGEGARMNTGGSGLGLYLAKTIVEGHKGRVWVESEGAGKGSTFFIELDAA